MSSSRSDRATAIRPLKERLLARVFLATAFVAVAGVILIFVFIGVKGIGIFRTVGVLSFLFGSNWAPTSGHFGILYLIIGSFAVTLGALVLGAPLAIATAVFLSEIATPRVSAVVRPAIELLAGIPSVIYGFFGLVLLVPLVRAVFGGSGFGLLTGWLVLAIMILPTIATISEDAITAVPRGYREGSFAMGATQWQTIWRVVLPAARSGLISAVVLGMGRAIGETMAVLMILGNAPILPRTLTDPIGALTSIIALDMSYASGEHQMALFAMGIVLFLISFSFVGAIRIASRSRRLT